MVWGTIFAFGVVFPLSIPRSMAALRFSSLFGFFCSIYLVSVITLLFWFNRNLVPDLGKTLGNIDHYFRWDGVGLLRTIPFIIFAYMYQPNVPLIYKELERQEYGRMEKVVIRGSGLVIFVYVFAATFG